MVLSCTHGRPVIHLYFRRCCANDIENDQVIFENIEDNILRERLIANGSLINETAEGTVLVIEDNGINDIETHVTNETVQKDYNERDDGVFNESKSQTEKLLLKVEDDIEVEELEMIKRLREVIVENPKFGNTFSSNIVDRVNIAESLLTEDDLVNVNINGTENSDIDSEFSSENFRSEDVLNEDNVSEIFIVKNSKHRKIISGTDVI